MTLHALTREQSRAVDRHAIDVLGFNSLVLMENAGRGAVDVLESLGIHGPVGILCGKGNNGGDGIVIARHLAIRGHICEVQLVAPADELTGDAQSNYKVLTQCGVPIAPFNVDGNQFDWLVDAMLGTGATGAPRAPYDAAIRWFNEQTTKKLAVDVPSGLDCDTGTAAGESVRADHTCTFFASKVGFAAGGASEFTGHVHVCDIGVPRAAWSRSAKS